MVTYNLIPDTPFKGDRVLPLTGIPGGGDGVVAKSCLTLATPWTVACQAPLSMGFSKQEYWSELACPSPGDIPNPGIKHTSPTAPAFQSDS